MIPAPTHRVMQLPREDSGVTVERVKPAEQEAVRRVPGLWLATTRAHNATLKTRVGLAAARPAGASLDEEPPGEGGGVTVERGNLPNSEQCGGSRLMAGDDTYT